MSIAPQKDQLSTCVKFQIKTFMGRYLAVEDRLWLDAVDGDGNNHSIFMSRRLTDKMLSLMVDHLDVQTSVGA